MSQQFAPDWFSPPGSTVAMLMDRQKVSSGELAHRMHADNSFVLRIISGTEPIEDEVAERLAAALGGTPSFWTARQRHSRQHWSEPQASSLFKLPRPGCGHFRSKT